MKKILYVDLDNTIVDVQSGIDRLSAANLTRYDGHYDDAPGIFALMDPLPGAIDADSELSGLFDTYIPSHTPHPLWTRVPPPCLLSNHTDWLVLSAVRL